MTIQNLNNSNSNTVQNRIISKFPNMTKWKNYQLILELLIDFFEGKHIHINDGWSRSRGHSSLIANKEGRKVLKILKTVNVSINFGNDAPKGGAVGQFFKCLRKNVTASAFFKCLLDEVKAK